MRLMPRLGVRSHFCTTPSGSRIYGRRRRACSLPACSRDPTHPRSGCSAAAARRSCKPRRSLKFVPSPESSYGPAVQSEAAAAAAAIRATLHLEVQIRANDEISRPSNRTHRDDDVPRPRRPRRGEAGVRSRLPSRHRPARRAHAHDDRRAARPHMPRRCQLVEEDADRWRTYRSRMNALSVKGR